MKRRRLNPRLAKIHRSYTVEEAARLLGVHKGTIRTWIKEGLPTTDKQRPLLILGRDLRGFIEKRRALNRRPCGPGQIYCLRCRSPRHPAGGLADWVHCGPSSGNLVGICPVCESMMYRRANFGKLHLIQGELQVAIPEARPRIDERPSPSLNRDFSQEAEEHANAQPEKRADQARIP